MIRKKRIEKKKEKEKKKFTYTSDFRPQDGFPFRLVFTSLCGKYETKVAI